MRTTAVALVALSLVLALTLAGCGAPQGSDAGSPTPSPTATERPDADPLARSIPGVDGDGLADPGALASAHERSLVATSFETRLVANATERLPDGDGGTLVESSTLQQVAAEAGPDAYRYRLQTRPIGSRFDVWANDSVQVTRAARDGTVRRYQVGTPQSPAAVTGAALVEEYLSLGEYAVAGATGRGEAARLTLRADALAVDETDGLFVRGSENVSNYSSTAVVDREGRVRALDVRADYTIDGRPATVDVSYRLVRTGGVTVDRPAWVATATEARDGDRGTQPRAASRTTQLLNRPPR
jgi:hypothetical protein